MERATLRAQRRQAKGSGAARRLRRSGHIPAVLYGAQEAPTPIEIELRAFQGLVKKGLTENTLINLLLDQEQEGDRLTLIRDVQRDPVRGGIRHLDFVHVDVRRKIEVEVPVHLSGSAEGVRLHGGILEQRLHQIQVNCLPTEIPEAFTVDISTLQIGDTLHVGDLDLKGFDIVTESDRTVVVLVPPRVLEEEKPEEPEVPTEPERVGRVAEQEEGAGEQEE
jgi:large subunit ribosomal protein L25